MEITQIDIKDITPYVNNAKKHDQKQIDNVAESIKQFGFIQPVVIDDKSECVIGHCRLAAAKKLGLKQVPCVKLKNLTEEQIKKLRVLDNKLNESEWDLELLKEDIFELNFDGFDVDFDFNEELADFDMPEQTGENELDGRAEKKPHICPKCGYEFIEG